MRKSILALSIALVLNLIVLACNLPFISVAITFQDPQNPYRKLLIQGKV